MNKSERNRKLEKFQQKTIGKACQVQKGPYLESELRKSGKIGIQ